MRSVLVAAILIAAAGSVQAEDKIERMTLNKMEVFAPDTLDWKDEPILPKGAKSVLIVGDPPKPGVFIAYLKFPPTMTFRPTLIPSLRSSPSCAAN
jgi:hypothetical protein